MLKKTGIATKDQVENKFKELLESKNCKGAILECYEDIPCNPCSTSCPTDAITVEPDINQQPVIDYDKCSSCGICVYNCPGLAIFVVEPNHKPNTALFKISYELLPLPEVGQVVKGISREGKEICDCTVTRIINGNKQDRTALLYVEVPKEVMFEFITVKVGE